MNRLNAGTARKITALLGAMGVALGAFGAHGLRELLLENGRLETWETAVFYHIVHGVVLLILASIKPWRQMAWLMMSTGVLIFSGSLYILCLTNITWLDAVTPIGGILLITGWLGMFSD